MYIIKFIFLLLFLIMSFSGLNLGTNKESKPEDNKIGLGGGLFQNTTNNNTSLFSSIGTNGTLGIGTGLNNSKIEGLNTNDKKLDLGKGPFSAFSSISNENLDKSKQENNNINNKNLFENKVVSGTSDNSSKPILGLFGKNTDTKNESTNNENKTIGTGQGFGNLFIGKENIGITNNNNKNILNSNSLFPNSGLLGNPLEGNKNVEIQKEENKTTNVLFSGLSNNESQVKTNNLFNNENKSNTNLNSTLNTIPNLGNLGKKEVEKDVEKDKEKEKSSPFNIFNNTNKSETLSNNLFNKTEGEKSNTSNNNITDIFKKNDEKTVNNNEKTNKEENQIKFGTNNSFKINENKKDDSLKENTTTNTILNFNKKDEETKEIKDEKNILSFDKSKEYNDQADHLFRETVEEIINKWKASLDIHVEQFNLTVEKLKKFEESFQKNYDFVSKL